MYIQELSSGLNILIAYLNVSLDYKQVKQVARLLTVSKQILDRHAGIILRYVFPNHSNYADTIYLSF